MIWILIYILEISFFCTPLWYTRRFLAPLLVCATVLSTGYVFLGLPPLLKIAIIPLTLFRIFNLSRVVIHRMHPHFLRKVTRRTAIFFGLYHLLAWLTVMFAEIAPAGVLLLALLAVMSFTSVLVLGVTIKNILKLSFKMPSKYIPDRDLPTITVAIPARNETTDLEECLRAIVANDYPKLEILVLDDCSQDKTADIIKSFAQDGVRFIQGDAPEERWLAKNHAYQKLFEQSNGKYILFCGVDTRLGLGAIRSMINLLHSRDKKMLSVLPLRVAGTPGNAVIQPMRYWWELAVPRRLFNRPAVLSTCWLIERAELKKLGGFKAVSHAIIPEGYFARELVKSDSYSFVRSTDSLDVRTVKSVQNQRSTAIRMRYPQARRRPETVLAITLVEIILFILPITLLIKFVVTGTILLPVFSIIALTSVLITHLLILQVSNPANVVVAIFIFPWSVLTELVIGYISMFKYEFGRVEWKDRNICIPVMHVYPKLPDIKA